jgi:hypothetical protein
LILSSAASLFLTQDMKFHTFSTKEHEVKDFSDEVLVSYREYKQRKLLRGAA